MSQPFLNLPFPYNSPYFYPLFTQNNNSYTCSNPYSCKIAPKTVLCAYQQPINTKQSAVKDPITCVEYDYNPTKNKANSPNQSHKLDYAAFVRRSSRTFVVSYA